MTEIFFVSQIERLKRRFGEKHFDIEFIKLVSHEARAMSDTGFQRAVDIWIGSRTHLKPPLLSEFREAKLNEERIRLENTIRGANTVLSHPAKQEGLKRILKEQYAGVSSVTEAVDLIKLRKNLSEAEGK